MNNEITAKKRLESFLSVLQDRGLNVSAPAKADYCFESEISARKERVKLRVYFGAKGLKYVIQGNKESELYGIVDNVVFGEKLFFEEELQNQEPDEYIGTDESGKGDYFGPLVISGVLMTKDLTDPLRSAGVKDSKLLSDKMIDSIAGEIKKIVNNRFSTVFISPAKYNELYERFGNLNKLLAWGHSRVIENLLGTFTCETVISDKFGDESLIRTSLMEKGKLVKLLQYHRAEKYTAVAAASIIARNEVNNWFRQQSKKFNVVLPKGASGMVDNTAAELVKKLGKEILPEIAKIHFKTTNKILG